MNFERVKTSKTLPSSPAGFSEQETMSNPVKIKIIKVKIGNSKWKVKIGNNKWDILENRNESSKEII